MKHKHKLLKRIISVTLILIIIMVNIACFKYANLLTLFLENLKMADKATIAKVTNQAEDMTKELEGEGIVLLENNTDTLPLDTSVNANINVFGWGSVAPIYSGSGSGGGNATNNITLQEGLKTGGFNVNDELTKFYNDLGYKRENAGPLNGFQPDLHLYEADVSLYTDELINDAKAFSDTALVVISRPGGEASDLATDMASLEGDQGRNMLELTSKEEALMDLVKKNFDKVIVVINAANAMELGFLKEEGVDTALWIGDPGKTGFESLAKVLDGEINPSGALTDTYAYDATSAPSYNNFGGFDYTNATDAHYVDYAEGIYVGYRYYETRYVNNQTGLCDEEAYHKAVEYPFGYGLSYTKFSQVIKDFKATNDRVEIEVDVTNIGNRAGKDIVQIYYTPPYYEGGIEKSNVVLGAFDKTDNLEPGKTQTIKLEIPIEDMASYDYKDKGAYVLEAGDYAVKLMDNAHDVIDSKSFIIDQTIVYDESNKRSTDTIAATNVFNDAAGDIKYVSRADWEGTLPKETARQKEASTEVLAGLNDKTVKVNDEDKDIIVKDNGLTLKDMTGLDYNDEKWNDLLEQLSVSDMRNLIGKGGYQTKSIKSIDKGATSDVDGPAGINAIVNGVTGVTYATEIVMASTWNIELVNRMGQVLAEEAAAYGINGIYAPAMNIHRSPFGGRNFEYYSEDAFLSGKMAAAEVSGIKKNGEYCYIKHFALNDQETNRNGVSIWANEQSIREIYLKPFETAVKEGNATAVMSAFNRLGTTWCGASSNLLQTVLRDEWNFRGMVITDYDGFDYMVTEQAIRAGNDLMLSTTGDDPKDNSNTGNQAMRNASHNILYTIANSRAVELTYKDSIPKWEIALLGINGVIVLGIILIVLRYRKKKIIKIE